MKTRIFRNGRWVDYDDRKASPIYIDLRPRPLPPSIGERLRLAIAIIAGAWDGLTLAGRAVFSAIISSQTALVLRCKSLIDKSEKL